MLKSLLAEFVKLIFLTPIIILLFGFIFVLFRTSCFVDLYVLISYLTVAVIVVGCIYWKTKKTCKWWQVFIVGVLSLILFSIVLASLNSSRTRAPNAALISQLINLRAVAEIYFDQNDNTYVDLCTQSNEVQQVLDRVSDEHVDYQSTCLGWFWRVLNFSETDRSETVAVTCQSDEETYKIISELPQQQYSDSENQYFCIDSTGYANRVAFNNPTDNQCAE